MERNLGVFFVLFCAFFLFSGQAHADTVEGLQVHNKTTLSGIILTGNTEKFTIGGREKLTIQKEAITDRLTAGITYSRDNIFNNLPVKTSDRDIFVKDKFLWNFVEKFYAYTGGGWLTHQTSGIDQQFDGLVGMGYKPPLPPKQTLSLEAGYDFEFRNRVSPFLNQTNHNASFGFDYLWQITDKTSLENETDNLFDVRHQKNIRVTSFTELDVEIVKHLALFFGFELKFENDPVPTFKKLNTTSTVGITANF